MCFCAIFYDAHVLRDGGGVLHRDDHRADGIHHVRGGDDRLLRGDDGPHRDRVHSDLALRHSIQSVQCQEVENTINKKKRLTDLFLL